MEMEDEQRYWRSRSQEYASHRKLLTERAAKIEEQIQILEAQQAEWHATWEQIRDSPGIKPVADRIFQQLNKIQAIREQVLQQLNLVLTLQNQISQQDQQISDVLIRIRQAREREYSRLLQLDSLPLWKIRELRKQDQGAGPVFQRPFHKSFQTVESFLSAGKPVIFWFAMAYVLTLFGILKLKDHVIRAARPEVSLKELQLLNRPFSVALLVSLLGTAEFAASSPVAIALSVYLLYLIPVLRLLAPWVEPWLRTFLYVLVTFSALEGMYLLVQLPPLMRREIYVLLVLAALVSFGWLAHSSRERILAMQGRSRRIFLVAIRGGLALLFASLVCSVIGAVSLSQVLGLVTLVGPFLAISLYCGARALTLILITILRTPWAGVLLEGRAYFVERWGGRILALAASLLWLRVMLRFFAAYGTVMGLASDALRSPIGLGRFHFTLGDALGLLFILLGGYLLANAFTFILKKVVLPKLPLRRGIPYAISTVTYYFLLLLVALFALFAAGVDLNKFTVLTGALGVGLGFGLQNIVNNFVSGLILIFERPISIGDTVDVGGLVGVVRRIGARASTVVTFQGAEVIVPNSNLISNQVINWTLSSPWRRIDVPLSIAYGTDPERVIKMLVRVAESHPGVLLARPPAAFFMGFGESALRFELRFWCADQDAWLQLQSDVTVAIAKALEEAGIEIPFPQRDLHLRSVDTPVAEALASNKSRTTSSDLSARSTHR
jgi:small-conductance mechanosensitive channel